MKTNNFLPMKVGDTYHSLVTLGCSIGMIFPTCFFSQALVSRVDSLKDSYLSNCKLATLTVVEVKEEN